MTEQPSLFPIAQYGPPKLQLAPSPEPKAAPAKRKPRGKPPYMVHLTWQDPNSPKMRQAEETIELAVSTVQHWFKQFAGVKSIVIEDVAENERHVYGHAGYMFTAPAL